MLERKYGWTIEADIHGMRVLEAKRELETLIGRADKSIREIVVIHGYHGRQRFKKYGPQRASASSHPAKNSFSKSRGNHPSSQEALMVKCCSSLGVIQIIS